MIKSSPLVDLKSGFDELKHVKTVYVIAVKNEVKELLWVLEKGYSNSPEIITHNILSITSFETFKFDYFMENEQETLFSNPLSYLYEPNHAILKSGGFKSIANTFNVLKLHINTHLYTSKSSNTKFPGRRFKITKVFTTLNKDLKQFKNKKINITTRNFPSSVFEIRKKYKIKEGGDLYLFFTTNIANKKIAILCEKLKK